MTIELSENDLNGIKATDFVKASLDTYINIQPTDLRITRVYQVKARVLRVDEYMVDNTMPTLESY